MDGSGFRVSGLTNNVPSAESKLNGNKDEKSYCLEIFLDVIAERLSCFVLERWAPLSFAIYILSFIAASYT